MGRVVEVAVVLLAVARLTRLVCADRITSPWRAGLVRRLPADSAWAYLVFCRWCVSIWIAAPAAGLWVAASGTPRWSGHLWIDAPAAGLALSYATGLLVRAEPEA